MDKMFSRAELLLGSENMERLRRSRVILFGVGGVGSWCAECLVRSGIGHLTIVDGDLVCPSNINRQLMATTETVGRVKVEVLRERLLTINPEAEVVALHKVFCEETAADFDLNAFDYVIDAIDSLSDKALLILTACQSRATLFSSMGAALKMDSTRIRVSEFWRVQGDPLARALRNRFKRSRQFPARKFQCVFSDEPPVPPAVLSPSGESEKGRSEAASPKGSLAHITAVFGFTLAGLVLRNIYA